MTKIALLICGLMSMNVNAQDMPLVVFSSPITPVITNDHLSATFGEPRGVPSNPDPLNHWHKGIDFAEQEGTHVFPVATGSVSYVGNDNVVLHHGSGWHTRYLHILPHSNMVLGAAVSNTDTVGDVDNTTPNHLHFEVYKFENIQQNITMLGKFDEARNPLIYPNLNGEEFLNPFTPANPTIEELRFNDLPHWALDNDSFDPQLTTPEQNVFIRPSSESEFYRTYLIAHVYDDITREGHPDEGATAPYRIVFTVQDQSTNLMFEEEIIFDDLIDHNNEYEDEDGENIVLLWKIYAFGSESSEKHFYYYKEIDLSMLSDIWGLEDINYTFTVSAEDQHGNRSERSVDVIVRPTENANPDIFVNDLQLENKNDYVRITFKANWMEDIYGIRIYKKEIGSTGGYHEITENIIEIIPNRNDFEYEFIDSEIDQHKTYTYKFEAVYQGGNSFTIEEFQASLSID